MLRRAAALFRAPYLGCRHIYAISLRGFLFVAVA